MNGVAPHDGCSCTMYTYMQLQIGVPGAFTPPCSSQVPGYIERAKEFIARGVKGIYVVAVNDTFVMQLSITIHNNIPISWNSFSFCK